MAREGCLREPDLRNGGGKLGRELRKSCQRGGTSTCKGLVGRGGRYFWNGRKGGVAGDRSVREGHESPVGEVGGARAAEPVTTQRALPGGILECGPAVDRLHLKITLAAVWKENILEDRTS